MPTLWTGLSEKKLELARIRRGDYFLVVLGVGVGGVRGRGAGGVLGRDGAPSECGRSPGRYEGDWGDG